MRHTTEVTCLRSLPAQLVDSNSQSFGSKSDALPNELSRPDCPPQCLVFSLIIFRHPTVVNLSIAATKFVDIDNSAASMRSFLLKKSAPSATTTTTNGCTSSSQPYSPGLHSQKTTPVSISKAKKGSISHFFNSPKKRSSSHFLNGKSSPCKGEAQSESLITSRTPIGAKNCDAEALNSADLKPMEDIVDESIEQDRCELYCIEDESSDLKEEAQYTDDSLDTYDTCNMGQGTSTATTDENVSEKVPNGSKPVNESNSTTIETETTPKSAKSVKRRGFFATKMLELEMKRKRENESVANNRCSDFKVTSADTVHCNTSTAPGTANIGDNDPGMSRKNHGFVKDLGDSAKNHGCIDDTDYSKCAECGHMISAWDLPEHLDFHFAQKLQKEQRQLQATGVATARTPVRTNSNKHKLDMINGTISKTSNKRSKTSNNQNTGQKTLDRFFRK